MTAICVCFKVLRDRNPSLFTAQPHSQSRAAPPRVHANVSEKQSMAESARIRLVAWPDHLRSKNGPVSQAPLMGPSPNHPKLKPQTLHLGPMLGSIFDRFMQLRRVQFAHVYLFTPILLYFLPKRCGGYATLLRIRSAAPGF